MNRTQALASASMAVASAGFLLAAAWADSRAPADSAIHRAAMNQYAVWQTFKLYCTTCHSGPTPPANLNLQALDLSNLNDNGATWEKLLRKLRNREMPPVGLPRPDEATYVSLVSSIENERDRLAEVKPDPGRPTLHRLNRAEYANAIRDLLSIDVDVSELLPADDTGYGFDNIGDVLLVSPLLLERYMAAASKVSRQAVGDPPCPRPIRPTTVPHGLQQEDRMSTATAGRLARRHHGRATSSRSMANTRFRSRCSAAKTTSIWALSASASST